jgi:tetratricopeptide (TPR) repeat protein
MFIIFGTRAYFRRNRVTQYSICPQCSQFARMQSFSAMRFFHLYYIPLIPIEGYRRNHKLCSRCNHGRTFTTDAYEVYTQQWKEDSAEAILALQEGDERFNSNENSPPVDCVAYLRQAIDWLVAAKEKDFCQGLVDQLASPTQRYARSMLQAELNLAQNQVDIALASYVDAASAKPASFEPHYARARLLARKSRYSDSIAAFQQACKLANDPAIVYDLELEMVDQQVLAKQWKEAFDTYQRIIAYRPELATHPPFAKLVAKAKKKAGL